MNKLPPELYLEIASIFETAVPYDPPRSAYPPTRTSYYKLIQQWFNKKPRPDVKNLRNLRLVSKAFNAAATVVLFRSTSARWWLGAACLRGQLNASIQNSILSPASPLPNKIKYLDIDFRHTGLRLLDYPPTNPRSPAHAESRELIYQLSNVLSSIPDLRSLSISTGTWTSHMEPVFYDSDDDVDIPAEPYAEDVDILAVSALMGQISLAFSAMTYPHLTELWLSLPCTHDFSMLGKSLPLFEQLKSLFLLVADETGPGGSLPVTGEPSRFSDEDDDMPSSNLQQQYPNKDYAAAMFEVVSRCTNLEILGLKCTHKLDDDLLSLNTSRLRCLSLHRMTISASKLIELLPPSTIARLWFESIELTSGTWADVFGHLQNCEKVEYINPSNCSYTRDGSSSHLILWARGPWKDSENVWSTHRPDQSSLVGLVEGIIDKWGGRENYPSLDMEQSMLPSESTDSSEDSEDSEDSEESEDSDDSDDSEDSENSEDSEDSEDSDDSEDSEDSENSKDSEDSE
ncbi:uncharacterized protein LY89DRAFT_784480 [Mollisia scopiformis]|uniref:Uncharacterized protein n=1 Tax=Mollisia scopiformis TaxID=149040 RepID=A0A194X2Z2_MOLSC|nr:uncharacterized protein LY89DRAFT_784480 [Mollisia scopiformis]KUJ14555.1 hypothetical protein LY89DRAFT_784480 [Mollisia scopiformis]